MGKERKKQLTDFSLDVAKNKFTDDEIMTKLLLMRPTFQELIFMDDLIQDFMKKIEKGEIKNEG